MAGGEQGPVDGQEVLREPVPDHDAGGQGQQVGLLGRVVPRRGAALGHVRLVEEERNEGHVPRGPGLEAVEDVLVAVAGERAPVVPGHSERLDVSSWLCNPRGPVIHSRRPAPSSVRGPVGQSSAPADQAEGGADGGPAEDVGSVVGPEVEPADADQRRAGEQQGVAGPVAPSAHDGGRAECGQRVPAREAAGLRLAHRHPALGQAEPDCGRGATGRRPP